MSNQCLIWSFEHGKWWRANGAGYTDQLQEAGRYGLLQALQICENSLVSDPLQHGEAILPLWLALPEGVQPLRTQGSRELLEVTGGPDGDDSWRKTGCYVRALRRNGWANVDITELDRDSLVQWLRSRGGENPLAEAVVLRLLGYE